MKRLTLEDLRGKKVAALVSGGLDSNFIIKRASEAGVKILAITVDLGQPDEKNIRDIPANMLAAGAEEAILIDGKDTLAELLLQVIQSQAWYEYGYWNTTGIARIATVVAALPEMIRQGIEYFIHGATGRGNDQLRFELVATVLNSILKVFSPWRNAVFMGGYGGRQEMIDFCKSKGLQIKATADKPYSTDANFGGLTHEAGVLEQLTTPTERVEFVMGVHPKQAPQSPEKAIIRFEKGRPTLLLANEIATENGKPVDYFESANLVAGRNGIGIVDQVENRVVGIKSRGVYEAPGVTLLGAAYNKLLQLILDREHRQFFEIVSRKIADLIYEGKWFYPLCTGLLAMVENITQYATGTVVFELYKGNILYLETYNVTHTLYNPDISSMEKIGDFDHESSQGLVEILNLTARALANAGQIRKP